MLIDPLPIKLEQELKYEIAYAALSSAATDGRLPKGIFFFRVCRVWASSLFSSPVRYNSYCRFVLVVISTAP